MGHKQCKHTGAAIWTLRCGDTGDEFDVHVPWERRYDSLGWGNTPRVRWSGGVGIEVSRGPEGITVIDAHGESHPLKEGTYTIDGTKEPEPEPEPKPKRGPLAKITRLVQGLRKAKQKYGELKPGQRWITVHPNGKGEKGVPVLISPAGDGSYRIVGGAKGKLNHMRLTGIKPKEEHDQEAKEKAKEKRADRKAKLDAMTPDERKAFRQSEKDQKEAIRKGQRKLVEKVREKLGGVDADLTEADLAGLHEKERAKLEGQHHRKQWRQARKRRFEASQDLVEELQERLSDQAAVERLISDHPEVDPRVHELAQREAEMVLDEEKRRAELRDSRKKPEGLRMARDVRLEAAETTGTYLEEKIDLAAAEKRVLGSDRSMESNATNEMEARALDNQAKARILHEAAKGAPIADKDQKVQEAYFLTIQEAMERTGTPADADDERIAEALQLEADYLVRKGQMDLLTARNMDEMDPQTAAQALAAIDATAGVAKRVREHVERLGLRERDRTPLREAEVAEITEVLADFAQFRKLKGEFASMVEEAEADPDFDKSRRAFDLPVGPPPESVVEDIQEQLLRSYAERLVGVASPARASHQQAVSAGHFMKLADISLALDDQRHLDRSTMEAVGVKNASTLLAFALQENGHDRADLLQTMERLHIQEQKTLTQEALQAADDFAPGIEAAVEGADDIERALQQMDVADADIDEAERMIGSALGQLEANATLGQVLRQDLPQELTVKMDANSTTWLASAGLTPDDYQIRGQGGAREVSIPRASWSKMLHKTPAEQIEQRKLAHAIKRGDMDEDGWLPAGMVSRAQNTFEDGTLEQAQMATPLDLNETGGNVKDALAKHIGQRIANGERADDIERDLRKRNAVPDGYHDAIAELMPKTKPEDVAQRAENERIQNERERLSEAFKAALANDDPDEAARLMAEQQALPQEKVVSPRTDADFADHYQKLAADAGGDGRSPMHNQSLYEDGTSPKQVKEVAFRALMEHPAATAAFRPLSELQHQDYAALRKAFDEESGSHPEHGWKEEFNAQLGMLMDMATGAPAHDDLDPKVADLVRESRKKAGAGQASLLGGGADMFGGGAPAAPQADEKMSPEKFAKDHPEAMRALARQYPREAEALHKIAAGERPPAPTAEQIARVPENIRSLAERLHEQSPRMDGAELAAEVRKHIAQEQMKAEGVELSAMHERGADGKLTAAAKMMRSRVEMKAKDVRGIRPDHLAPLFAGAKWDADGRSFENLKARVGTPWAQFVDLHGGQAPAYEALQDIVRGRFLAAYRKHHGRVTGKELRGGVTDITGRETHLQALASPRKSRDVRAARRKELDEARNRQGKGALSDIGTAAGGRYASGAAIAAATAKRRELTEAAQRQGTLVDLKKPEPSMFGAPKPEPSMFGAPKPAPTLFGGPQPTGPDFSAGMDSERKYETIDPTGARTAPNPGERVTIGERAEGELGAMLRTIGHQVDPRQASNPDALFPGASMDKQRIHGQRVIKLLRKTKRGLMAIGTGGGKTAIAIGAFTDLHATGDAQKCIMLVPKAVEGQFASEMNTFTEPGKYKWATGDGRQHQGRMDILKDRSTHMAVLTHQSAARTLGQMVADHQGKAVDVAMAEFRRMKPKERAAAMSSAMEAAGIPRSMIYVDESHMLTTRKGAQESDAAMLIGALSHPTNASHFLMGSATPNKNDLSEVYSNAALLNPDVYGDREKFIRSYGDGSIEAPDAIRRELDHYVYTAKIPPKGVKRIDTHNPSVQDGKKVEGGPLELEPEHLKEVEGVQTAYDTARQAWSQGRVDTDAIKVLAPHRFAGQPESDHEAIARTICDEGLGAQKRNATRKAIDQAPFEHNTKFKRILDVVRHDLQTQWSDIKGNAKDGKRPLMFVDSSETADHLAKFLQENGLSAGVYSGRLSTDARDKWKGDYKSGAMQVGILTAAGEAGINITSANTIHHVDVPLTAKSHTQRTGRAFRQRQLGDVDVHQWSTDTAFERNEMRRLNRKGRLGSVFETPLGPLDEHGVAALHGETMEAKHASWDAMHRLPIAAK